MFPSQASERRTAAKAKFEAKKKRSAKQAAPGASATKFSAVVFYLSLRRDGKRAQFGEPFY